MTAHLFTPALPHAATVIALVCAALGVIGAWVGAVCVAREWRESGG